MDDFRMDRIARNITQHPLVWPEVGVAGSFNGFISERVPGYVINKPRAEWCVVYDPRIQRVARLEHR